jgi:predicted acylesterase/phospholipase RssA
MDTSSAALQALDAKQSSDLLCCDVVMKGGITSGVVYPTAVSELSKTYQFKNIGGTSAGAIAAACTAAAEFRRHHHSQQAFSGLDKLSETLGTPRFLTSLFQPTAWTRGIFSIAMSFVGNAPILLKLGRATVSAAVGFWPLTLAALVVDTLLYLWLRTIVTEPVIWFFVAVTWFAVLAISWAIGLGWSLGFAIPGNYLGMCRGVGANKAHPPLTTWLANKIDELAGIEDKNTPLTFGDLWRAEKVASSSPADDYADLPPTAAPAPSLAEERREFLGLGRNPAINLEMMTTCLTLGRPFRLPMAERIFFIDIDDAISLFPRRIADWLIKNAAHPRYRAEAILYQVLRQLKPKPLIPLPPPELVPIVVAARMSLSFPVLISAIKLRAVDYQLPRNKRASDLISELAVDTSFDLDRDSNDPRLAEIQNYLLPEPCWFSDGGLTHNFPVHFFDGPLPLWPTFAIDLDALPEGESDDSDPDPTHYVKLPGHNYEGIDPSWNRIERTAKPSIIKSARKPSFYSFVTAIVSTMQNWSDDAQSSMPGYRDRIVHIELSQNEGGLNLNMPTEVVKKLADRGRAAGEVLAQAFAVPRECAPQWLNHRWVRYRNFMALCQSLITSFHDSFSRSFAPGPTYQDLVVRTESSPPASYRWLPNQEAFATTQTKNLDALASGLNTTLSFEEGAPRPRGELAIRPVL